MTNTKFIISSTSFEICETINSDKICTLNLLLATRYVEVLLIWKFTEMCLYQKSASYYTVSTTSIGPDRLQNCVLGRLQWGQGKPTGNCVLYKEGQQKCKPSHHAPGCVNLLDTRFIDIDDSHNWCKNDEECEKNITIPLHWPPCEWTLTLPNFLDCVGYR